MTDAEYEIKTVLTGEWLYDNSVKKPVYIVRLNWDFWYGIGEADGDLEPDEEPQLNPDGFLYYTMYKSPPESPPVWVRGIGYETVEQAANYVESEVPSAVSWDKDPSNVV